MFTPLRRREGLWPRSHGKRRRKGVGGVSQDCWTNQVPGDMSPPDMGRCTEREKHDGDVRESTGGWGGTGVWMEMTLR